MLQLSEIHRFRLYSCKTAAQRFRQLTTPCGLCRDRDEQDEQTKKSEFQVVVGGICTNARMAGQLPAVRASGESMFSTLLT